MKTQLKLTSALTLILLLTAPSVFAESRHQRETISRVSHPRNVTVEGRIRDIDRQRNGFVIRLDRGGHVLFASRDTEVYSRVRGGRTSLRQLERGDVIRAQGRLESRGLVDVHTIRLLREEDDRRDRNDHKLQGIVQSIDESRRMIWVRDERSGRSIPVNVRHAGLRGDRNDRWDDDEDWNRGRDRHRDDDFFDLRRGDRVTIRGDWERNGVFEAERIQVHRGRW